MKHSYRTVLVAVVIWLAATPADLARGTHPRMPFLPAGLTSKLDPFTTPAARRYLSGRAGEIDAAVYDLKSGRTYCYRPWAREDAASVMKVDILATLLAELQAAHRVLSGEALDLATTMIENSDNDAAQDLWDQEGGAEAVARFDARIAMLDTTPGAFGAWGLSETTACDQVTLLRQLAFPNLILTTASRERALLLMSAVEPDQRWGITSGPPVHAAVAVKNGWLPVTNGWQINSDGYVHGNGRNYVVSVMTSGSPTEAYGIETIETLSRFIWRDLAPGRLTSTPSGESLEPSQCRYERYMYCAVLQG